MASGCSFRYGHWDDINYSSRHDLPASGRYCRLSAIRAYLLPRRSIECRDLSPMATRMWHYAALSVTWASLRVFCDRVICTLGVICCDGARFQRRVITSIAAASGTLTYGYTGDGLRAWKQTPAPFFVSFVGVQAVQFGLAIHVRHYCEQSGVTVTNSPT